MGFSTETARPVVLFDLDGTLLPMDMKTFERAYFQKLTEAFPEFPPQELVRCIWAGTGAMVRNDGSRTNREAFAEVFSRESGIDYWENEARFLEFYRTGFQDCARVCRLTDCSRRIVEALREKGYTVAIATNPIFPEVATHSRLRWLGLDPASFPLVTAFENSHYAKPNPAYYEEVCRALGAAPADCLMIGNDVREDGCARQLGMEVFLVEDCLLNPDGLPTVGFATGSLEDVRRWAEALPPCPAPGGAGDGAPR